MAKAKTIKTKNKPGRKSKQTPELVQEIGRRIGEGEPLAVICRDKKLEPDTVRNWMAKDDAIARLIAHARDDGEQSISQRLRLVARGGEGSSGNVLRDKLIIDTDLKLLAKWNPKKWGDKVQLADADGNKLPDPPQLIVLPVAVAK